MEGRLVKSLNGTRQEYERRRDGPLIEYVKDERGLITRTERDSYRNVVLIEHPDGGVERWTDGSLAAANHKNRDEAKAFIERIGANGGTNLYGAPS